jgi:hypothetical protein
MFVKALSNEGFELALDLFSERKSITWMRPRRGLSISLFLPERNVFVLARNAQRHPTESMPCVCINE